MKEVTRVIKVKFFPQLFPVTRATPCSSLFNATQKNTRCAERFRSFVSSQQLRHIALNSLANDDPALLAAVNHGELNINGFCNNDLQTLLYKSRRTMPPNKSVALALSLDNNDCCERMPE